ncbi:MAG: transporter substrate-binding domain-containing protein [Chloroflexota bacterium]
MSNQTDKLLTEYPFRDALKRYAERLHTFFWFATIGIGFVFASILVRLLPSILTKYSGEVLLLWAVPSTIVFLIILNVVWRSRQIWHWVLPYITILSLLVAVYGFNAEMETLTATMLESLMVSSPTKDIVIENTPTPTDTPLSTIVPTNPPITDSISRLQTGQKIVVAYSFESAPFSYSVQDDGTYNMRPSNNPPQGLEVEMIREFVRRVRSQADLDVEKIDDFIDWKPISTRERIQTATDPEIDLVIGAVSHTPDRCDSSEGRVCTSKHHLTDNAALLVRTDENIDGLCSPQLEGKNIVVLSNTTNQSAADSAFAKCNPEIIYSLTSKTTRSQAIWAVLDNEANRVVGYVSNYAILKFHKDIFDNDESSEIVDREFTSQIESAVFIMPKKNMQLRDLLEEEVHSMVCNTVLWNDWLEEFGLSEFKGDRKQCYR